MPDLSDLTQLSPTDNDAVSRAHQVFLRKDVDRGLTFADVCKVLATAHSKPTPAQTMVMDKDGTWARMRLQYPGGFHYNILLTPKNKNDGAQIDKDILWFDMLRDNTCDITRVSVHEDNDGPSVVLWGEDEHKSVPVANRDPKSAIVDEDF